MWESAYQVEPLREDRSYIGPQHPGAAVRPAEGRLLAASVGQVLLTPRMGL
jgi:hypothetical protein